MQKGRVKEQVTVRFAFEGRADMRRKANREHRHKVNNELRQVVKTGTFEEE